MASSIEMLCLSLESPGLLEKVKVARNEVKNASFAQRTAHGDSRTWHPELIDLAAERKQRARNRSLRQKLAYPHRDLAPVQIDLAAACTDSGKSGRKCEYPP